MILKKYMNNREKSSETTQYSVQDGDSSFVYNRKIEQTRQDNGQKDTYIKTNIYVPIKK